MMLFLNQSSIGISNALICGSQFVVNGIVCYLLDTASSIDFCYMISVCLFLRMHKLNYGQSYDEGVRVIMRRRHLLQFMVWK